ncbi:hypothetical protein [Pedobacter nyackensis]|uniref:Uncharacterized protein n=1 Tax=Pedobacter nyackensis TaxID=475255 RepID=A0A1W2F992_9SPHI|nr:hypothetical protein [Pedobacter nyackensis]SMD18527.1 hypothetical protein SAMN04488101_12710 [Pedobacter nyackensis]
MHIIQVSKSVALSKSNFRNMFRLALITGVFIVCFTSCKKGGISGVEVEPVPNTKQISLSDSIYFEVDGKVYTANSVFSMGIGNSGANMRFLDAPVAGRKNWGTLGGKSYYASVDSIYLSYGKSFSGPNDYGNLHISFGKGFQVKDLNYIGAMWYAKDIRNMLDKGKQEFAIDYQSTNSIDGVSFVVDRLGRTGRPEFSFDDSSDSSLQDDAHFEITEKEQVDKDRYRISARFEMNLYDDKGKKYRATKGFLRLNVFRFFWQTDLFSGSAR